MRHPTKEETFRASELVSPDMLPLRDDSEVWEVLGSEANAEDVDEALLAWRARRPMRWPSEPHHPEGSGGMP